MPLLIYLDESGDLGWNFTAPYRDGGSSRFLTIGALCLSPTEKHFPKRVVKNLYDHFGWRTSEEMKWSAMTTIERNFFAAAAKKMCDAHPNICLRCITVNKQKVMSHIQNDGNKLYNYMIAQMLMNPMSKHDEVTMVPDPRSVKVRSGNSLHDYLQTDLWFVKKVSTRLRTTPEDSKDCRGIQFTDMFCGLVQAHFEDGEETNHKVLAPRILQSRLYFA